MIVAFDYNAALRQVAGIGRYARELVRSFAALESGDELVLVYAAQDLTPGSWGIAALHDLRRQFPAIRTVGLPISERWLTIAWQRARLPLAIERWTGPVDVVHAPDFVLPPVRRARTVVTVHDLTFRVHPETAHPRLRRYLEQTVPRSLHRADQIVAVSRSTAADLTQLMDIPAERITVIPHGISPQFQRVVDPTVREHITAKYRLAAPFLLHVGTIEPRKNLERLIRVFAELRLSHPGLELILAGKSGWLAEPMLQAAKNTPGVRLIGPVDDADLPGLYTLACGVVYPSLYEGFGFPALEALACGTPVVAANTSSLPEVVGNAGTLVDPHDEPALATALAQLLDDPEVARTARIAGPAQAASYTWERAARQVQAVYAAAVQGKR